MANYSTNVPIIAKYMVVHTKGIKKMGNMHEAGSPAHWSPSAMTIRTNSYGWSEFVLDLSGAMLQGSLGSYNPTQEMISQFRVVFNKQAMALDAHMSCINDSVCREAIGTPQEIIRLASDVINENAFNTSYT